MDATLFEDCFSGSEAEIGMPWTKLAVGIYTAAPPPADGEVAAADAFLAEVQLGKVPATVHEVARAVDQIGLTPDPRAVVYGIDDDGVPSFRMLADGDLVGYLAYFHMLENPDACPRFRVVLPSPEGHPRLLRSNTSRVPTRAAFSNRLQRASTVVMKIPTTAVEKLRGNRNASSPTPLGMQDEGGDEMALQESVGNGVPAFMRVPELRSLIHRKLFSPNALKQQISELLDCLASSLRAGFSLDRIA